MKRKNQTPYKRSQRVGDEIARVISEAMIDHVSDPRVKSCSITSVKISDDLKNAKIYYSIFDKSDQTVSESLRAFNKATGFFKKIIGSKLKLRYIPDIRFYFDGSLVHGQEISSLIDTAVNEDVVKKENREGWDEINRTRILEKIKECQSFLICAHERPDGDAVGAVLGLGIALIEFGKDVVIYNASAPPNNVMFLPGIDLMTTTLPDEIDFDVVFVLDCGELDRTGPMSEKLVGHKRLINVDHHQTNDEFGAINYVNEKASSTGELIFKLLEQGNINVSPDAAINLYTAIYTDTMALSTPSASSEAFRICGELVKKGINIREAAVQYYFHQTEKRVRLLAKALESLKIEEGGEIAGISLTQKEMAEIGAGPDDVEGFIEFPRNIDGVQVAYFLREGRTMIKGSLRSGNAVDSATIAATLGGGGHAPAAGFRTEGALEDVRKALIEKLFEALKEK